MFTPVAIPRTGTDAWGVLYINNGRADAAEFLVIWEVDAINFGW
jgi:hypothetical protein